MPEGVNAYPRYDRRLSTATRIPILIENEIRQALRRPWTLFALLLGAAWGLGSIIEFHSLRETLRTEVASHDGRGFTDMLDQLLWASLGVAAALGGPAIVSDVRSGAMELYYSRAVKRHEYVTSKIVATLVLTMAPMVVPAIAYWAFSFVFYDAHPDWWVTRAVPGALVYAFFWGALVSGLALGLSAISRLSGAVALLLFGTFATLHYIVDPPAIIGRVASLTALTEDPRASVLTPFSWMDSMQGTIFGNGRPGDYPAEWGALLWLTFTALGWGLLAWRHPRPRGSRHE